MHLYIVFIHLSIRPDKLVFLTVQEVILEFCGEISIDGCTHRVYPRDKFRCWFLDPWQLWHWLRKFLSLSK